MRNYVQPGEEGIKLTAPSGGVVSGNGYQIGQLFVVAAHDAAEGDPFSGYAEGVFDLPKHSGNTPGEGALLYWDNSGHEVTTTSTSHLLIGAAVVEAASGDATVRVRLNGTARANEAGS